MSYYDAAVGAYPYPYPYTAPAYPLAGPVRYDIIGQEPPPVEPSLWEKTKAFGQKETLGIKNQNLLLGAAALGTIYYGYTAGWFGRR